MKASVIRSDDVNKKPANLMLTGEIGIGSEGRHYLKTADGWLFWYDREERGMIYFFRDVHPYMVEILPKGSKVVFET